MNRPVRVKRSCSTFRKILEISSLRTVEVLVFVRRVKRFTATLVESQNSLTYYNPPRYFAGIAKPSEEIG